VGADTEGGQRTGATSRRRAFYPDFKLSVLCLN
jgi:hypothetical protein